jgi:hypothetical protein
MTAAPISMFWRRLDTPGHDACWLEQANGRWRISGATVFRHDAGPAVLNYHVVCSQTWTTLSGFIDGRVGERPVRFDIRRGANGWTLNGAPVPGLDAMLDLDLSFTPATNLIQLRRVSVPAGRKTPIDVAWLDIDAVVLGPLHQVYERLDERRLAYAAPSVGYEAVLELADNGFIAHYPGLWRAE